MANANSTVTAPAPAPAPAPDPNTTVVIIAPDGSVYQLTQAVWAQASLLVTDPNQLVIPVQATKIGAYLTFPPDDGTGAVGMTCTIVNLQAVLANNRSAATADFFAKNKWTAQGPATGKAVP